jgi:hypothetical protein
MNLNSLTILFVKMTSSYFFAIFHFFFFPRYIPIEYLHRYLSMILRGHIQLEKFTAIYQQKYSINLIICIY